MFDARLDAVISRIKEVMIVPASIARTDAQANSVVEQLSRDVISIVDAEPGMAFQTFSGVRNTNGASVEEQRQAEFDALRKGVTEHGALMMLHSLGYDVSEARVVSVNFDPYTTQRARAERFGA